MQLAAAERTFVENVSTLNPASPPAESIRFLFIFVTAVGAFILAIVWGVLFYSLLRFRAASKYAMPTGGQCTTEPPQVYGSMPIEIAWTVAPGLIVLLLTLVIVRTELEVRANAAPNAGTRPCGSAVIGHQWWWEYVVKSDGEQNVDVVTANELHVPVSAAGSDSADDSKPAADRPIYLTLQSADVCHSFWIPRLAGKTDLIPGRTKTNRGFKRPSQACISGNAPSIAARSTPTCCCACMSIRRNDFATWLANEEKPAVDDPGGARRDSRRFCRNRASIATRFAARRRTASLDPI